MHELETKQAMVSWENNILMFCHNARNTQSMSDTTVNLGLGNLLSHIDVNTAVEVVLTKGTYTHTRHSRKYQTPDVVSCFRPRCCGQQLVWFTICPVLLLRTIHTTTTRHKATVHKHTIVDSKTAFGQPIARRLVRSPARQCLTTRYPVSSSNTSQVKFPVSDGNISTAIRL